MTPRPLLALSPLLVLLAVHCISSHAGKKGDIRILGISPMQDEAQCNTECSTNDTCTWHLFDKQNSTCYQLKCSNVNICKGVSMQDILTLKSVPEHPSGSTSNPVNATGIVLIQADSNYTVPEFSSSPAHNGTGPISPPVGITLNQSLPETYAPMIQESTNISKTTAGVEDHVSSVKPINESPSPTGAATTKNVTVTTAAAPGTLHETQPASTTGTPPSTVPTLPSTTATMPMMTSTTATTSTTASMITTTPTTTSTTTTTTKQWTAAPAATTVGSGTAPAKSKAPGAQDTSPRPRSPADTVGQKGRGSDKAITGIAEETRQLVDRGSLLVVFLLGLLFFLVTIILFLRQAYESYRKKDYTQMDYLINGMYSDSGV